MTILASLVDVIACLQNGIGALRFHGLDDERGGVVQSPRVVGPASTVRVNHGLDDSWVELDAGVCRLFTRPRHGAPRHLQEVSCFHQRDGVAADFAPLFDSLPFVGGRV